MDDFDSYEIEEELVAVIPSQQNLKGICISVLVIKVVLGLVTLSVFLMTPPDLGPRVHGARMSLHNLTSDSLKPNKFNATWVSDTTVAYINGGGDLDIFNAVSKMRTTLVSKDVFRSIGGNDYSLSPDLQWVMVRHKVRIDIFPHTALYTLQNISSSTNPLLPLSIATRGDVHDTWIQYAAWTRDSGLVMVHGNNIYYQPNVLGEVIRVTNDGVPGVVFNGVSDWLYKESVLKAESALWLTDDTRWMAFLKINDSMVSTISYQNIDTTSSRDPGENLKYAKREGKIPDVHLYVFNLVTRKLTLIQPPDTLQESSYYVSDVKWISNGSLFCSWTVRGHRKIVQTVTNVNKNFLTTEIYSADLSSKLMKSLSVENSPLFSEDLKSFLTIIPEELEDNFEEGGLKNSFNKIVWRKLSFSPGSSFEKNEKQVSVTLTLGRLELCKILSWDQNNDSIYFLARDKEEAVHLYKSSSNLSTAPHKPDCITCEAAPPCDVNHVIMSPDNSFFIQDCKGPSIPFTRIFQTSNLNLILELDNNDRLRDNMNNISLPQVSEIFLSSSPSTGIKLFLPPGYRETDEFLFPLLIYFFDNYDANIGWDYYLASRRDIVVAHISTGLDMGSSYGIIRQLTSELSYVDPSKVAIYGSELGGWMAGSILIKDHQSLFPVVKCAILQSPIAQWNDHDAFFTEKYFGPAASNKTFWTLSDHWSLIDKIESIPSKSLYLVHPPGVPQLLPQSLLLSRALVDNGLLFKQQIYLEKTKEAVAIRHMYKSMEHYLEDCYGSFEDHFRDDYFLASLEASQLKEENV